MSPRARWLWRIEGIGSMMSILAAQGIWWWRDPASPQPLQWWVLAATVVTETAYLVVMPQWRYRVHRWEVTPEAVYTQTGWFNQERRIAPIVRIQTVDLARGPVAQLLGLASVRVTTASSAGPLRIHGLDHALAVSLVEQLTELTVSDPGDAT
ncbi:MAG TPA: PH domain-containing protein [Dermatophilaceae bacterium]|nr:PH domain-containing protein [Dermatophilaceae bacterium]HMT89245.1 PH domain-containing protein [Dermatophilaceae bacterium]